MAQEVGSGGMCVPTHYMCVTHISIWVGARGQCGNVGTDDPACAVQTRSRSPGGCVKRVQGLRVLEMDRGLISIREQRTGWLRLKHGRGWPGCVGWGETQKASFRALPITVGHNAKLALQRCDSASRQPKPRQATPIYSR